MPSGVTIQITVPDGAGPGTILEVADPGAPPPAVAAAPAYPNKAAAYGGEPTGQVVGIVADGMHSDVSNVTALGQQTMPAGYDLIGDKYGIVARTLGPGEEFHSEPGAMVFMSEFVKLSAKFGGFFKTVSQAASGEALVKVSYTNETNAMGYVAMTPNQPFSMVVPVQMQALPGGTINVKRGAYMAGSPDVSARAKMLPAKDLTACCCGGLPPIIQEVHGTGTAFLSASGTVVARPLQAGEEIIVDSNVIVGFENTVSFEVRKVGGFMTCCFGGEGCYNTVFTGPGNVYLQSINISKLMDQLVTVTQEQDNADSGNGAPAKSEVMAR